MPHATSASDPGGELQTAVADLLARVGIQRTARTLGVSREALARVAAGVTVRPGTLALIRQRLSETKAAEDEP